MSLGEYIKARIHVDSYLGVDGYEHPRWFPTPFWNGNLMPKFKAISDDHCRLLYTFRIGSKRFLLKIDDDPSFLQCPHEIRTWNRLEMQDKRYFVPIMCGNGTKGSPSWVVCPVVPRLYFFDYEANSYNLIERLRFQYNISDLHFNKNWFLYNGRPLIVDYGVPGTYRS